MNRRNVSVGVVLLVILAAISMSVGLAQESDPHAAHHKMMQSKARYARSTESYTIPAAIGQDASGAEVDVQALLESDSPLIVNFIFTSCQTICPVLSATFSQAQESLAELPARPMLISLSIDPEYDTPERLAKYAAQFRAGDDWLFVTGDSETMLDIQKSFDAYRGDKLNHVALTYMRTSNTQPWLKLEGFLSASQLVDEYASLVNMVAKSD